MRVVYNLILVAVLISMQGGTAQIYSKLPSYRGYDLNCTVCQGNSGDPCDATPEELPHTTPCRGRCVVWRTLYNTGRAMRTVYRGCEDIIFNRLLPDAAKNACVYDNFFAECTTLCDSGHRCNQQGTGIPKCWDCKADFQPCDVEPETNCTDPIITATESPQWKIKCVSCVGPAGSPCDVSPQRVEGVVWCNDTCATWRAINAINRTTDSVWRGCKDTLFPHVLHQEALDSCDHSEVYTINCAEQCNSPLCNKYSTGISTKCWTPQARLKDDCKRNLQSSSNPFLEEYRLFKLSESGSNNTNFTHKGLTRFYRRRNGTAQILWSRKSASASFPPNLLLTVALQLLTTLHILNIIF